MALNPYFFFLSLITVIASSPSTFDAFPETHSPVGLPPKVHGANFT